MLLGILPGQRLLDPFCGGGTILLESMVSGRTCFGNDLSPVAVEVAWARTRLWDANKREAFLAAAKSVSEEAQTRCKRKRPAPIPPRVLDLRAWYAPQMLGELGWLFALSQEIADDDIRRMLRALHSACVIKFSLRASDTSNQRVDVQRPPGSACRHFEAKAEELCGQFAQVWDATPESASAMLFQGDAATVSLPAPVNAILTSPPYPGTYDYIELQQLRLAWYGWSLAKDQLANAEVGSRRIFKQPLSAAISQWTRQTETWMRHVISQLLPGGRLCVVIGDGLIRGRTIDTAQPTRDCAQRLGLTFLAAASVERADVAVHRPRREHALVFERPLAAPSRT